ncbi:MAG: DUF4202 family protein [Labilithrix sp.]|nr:DUF4202 family protein [Labilithrix sp.]MBX3221472.1 DUF4202 family protein [Labilithrix sp.]
MSAVVSKELVKGQAGPGVASAGPLSVVGRRRTRAMLEPEIARLLLVADEDEELDTSTIVREFPTVAVERVERCGADDLVIDDFAWRGAFDFRRMDEAVEHARPVRRLAVRGSDAAGVAVEVMARYQRLVVRRNEASSAPLFDAVLEAHASLFDPTLPLIRADHEHALDTWQWMLRIAPDIGLAPQIAALFHDIDRLESESHERIEHRAHRVLDDPQARRGGERALAILRGLGVEEEDAVRVRDLVGGHVQGEEDAAVLDDADALSFLSLMSPRYADYFGLAQTRRKVAFTLGRLGPVARAKVALFRLRPDVDRLLQPG